MAKLFIYMPTTITMLHLLKSCFKLQKSYDLTYLDIFLNVLSAVKYV